MGRGETGNLKLAPQLDIKAATPMAAELVALRGAHLVINASAVERVGAQCLQVLLSAVATWQADGLDIELAEPSTGFVAAVETAGLDIANFSGRHH